MLPNQNETNSSREIIYEMYFPQKIKSVSKEREDVWVEVMSDGSVN